MKPRLFLGAAVFTALLAPAFTHQATAQDLGEVIVTANRLNARYAQQDRPVVGLRRQADSAIMQMWFTSDARDEAVRKREIHTMVLAALDRSAAAGVEMVTGNFELIPLTKSNYQDLPFFSAGRVDTSRTNVMIKTKLAGSLATAEQRLISFIKDAPKSGRGVVENGGGLTLTIINPDQYRDTIVKQVAENARSQAAMFGPDYAVQINGVDRHVLWSQVSRTDVFLYVPYSYTIVPK